MMQGRDKRTSKITSSDPCHEQRLEKALHKTTFATNRKQGKMVKQGKREQYNTACALTYRHDLVHVREFL